MSGALKGRLATTFTWKRGAKARCWVSMLEPSRSSAENLESLVPVVVLFLLVRRAVAGKDDTEPPPDIKSLIVDTCLSKRSIFEGTPRPTFISLLFSLHLSIKVAGDPSNSSATQEHGSVISRMKSLFQINSNM